MSLSQQRRRSRGFTLIEMMVSIAVLGVVSIYLTDMLIRQSRTYAVVDQVTEVQQNLRAIADLLEREARATGFMVPEASSFCGIDNTNGSDIVFFTDGDAINPLNQVSLNLGVPITGGYVGTGTDVLNLAGPIGNPTTTDDVPFYDNDNDGVADSDFLANNALGLFGGVIVVDRGNPGLGAACGLVRAAGANSITVDFTMRVGPGPTALVPAPDPIAAGVGADLVAIPAHWYAVVPPAASGATSPQLWRDNLVLADDVEDLQFAAFFDVDGDGLVTGNVAAALEPARSATEYPGSANPGVQYAGDDWDHSQLRELRINFVVRTRNQDADALANPAARVGSFETTENRAPPGGPADGFRRRVHTITVKPRNLGLRPLES